MKKLSLAFVILFFTGLLGCNSNHKRLGHIDEIMETEPEHALNELNHINRSMLSHNDSAYFALLYTQAQVRCRIMVSSDSLIKVAHNRYRRSKSDNLRTRAYFYNAKVFFNKGELKNSIKDAVIAYDIAKSNLDALWIARSAELISDIYFQAFNFWQSEIYEHEAVTNYLLANKIENHRYALVDLATTYINENKYDQALTLLDSLLDIANAEEQVDQDLINYLTGPRLSALYYSNHLKELKEQIGAINLLPEKKDSGKIEESIIQSHILNDTSNEDSASVLLSVLYGLTGDERDRAWIKFTDYQQAMQSGNYKKAALMADSVLQLQNKIVKELVQESIAGEQRDYYSTKAEYQQRRSELMTHILVGVIVVALIITALLVAMYRLKMRAKKAELEASLSELIRVRERAELIDTESRSVSSRLSSAIEKLFHEKWQTLNMLCNEYFELGDSPKTRIAILNNIRQELEKQRTPENMKAIEEAVNLYMGNLMTMLREECPFLKENDYRFMSLVFAGMSVRAVCLFMDIKYKLFYLKRSRIVKRIADSDAPHKDLFLRKMGVTKQV